VDNTSGKTSCTSSKPWAHKWPAPHLETPELFDEHDFLWDGIDHLRETNIFRRMRKPDDEGA